MFPKRPGVISGSFGRLIVNAETFPTQSIPIDQRFRQSRVLSINRGKKKSMMSVIGAEGAAGDRVSGPASEPAATLRSSEGFKGKIVFDTPTTTAPTFRASFSGGGADSVPTVTVITPSQSRIATTMTKRRMIRRAGRNLVHPYHHPGLYDQTAPKSAQKGPFNQGSRNRRSKSKGAKGNIKEQVSSANMSSILQAPNQADTDITSQFPNPIEPLPPTDPIEQQGNQYSNFRAPLRIPMQSRDFPVLAANRGLDQNLDGKGPEMGPFDTEDESDARLSQVHGIVWG